MPCLRATSVRVSAGPTLSMTISRFLLQRPRPPPFRTRQHLNPSTTTARTTNRTSALYLADQLRGDRVHSELGSRETYPPLGSAPQPLRNSANGFIFFGKGGVVASNRLEEQEVSVHALHLLQSCLVYVKTLML